MQGTQTQYSLIPTKHTDSIIAVAGEELGFLGCAAVLLLLTLIIARCIATAMRARDGASGLIAAGIAGMLIFQTVLNIGMNIGVLPVVGLTLPFFSYGGTSVVTMYAAMGVAAGIRRAARMEKQNIHLGRMTMKKIVVLSQFNEDCRRILAEAAAGAELVFSSADAADAALVADAGMIVGPIAPSLLPEAKKLEVLQLQSAGADGYIKPGVLPETVDLCNATERTALPLRSTFSRAFWL